LLLLLKKFSVAPVEVVKSTALVQPSTIQITLLDDTWPKIKMLINRDGYISESHQTYDTAAVAFEVLVRNALDRTVAEIVAQRKKS